MEVGYRIRLGVYMNRVARQLLLSLTLLLPSHGEGAPAPVETYPWHGSDIQLVHDPTTLAFQTTTAKAISTILDSAQSSVEILWQDTAKGRATLRFETATAAETFASAKGSDLEMYPVYRYEVGDSLVWAFDEISIRIDSGASVSILEDYCSRHGLMIAQPSRFDRRVYLLRILDPSKRSAFDRADDLRAEEFVEWSEPNLYGGATLSQVDPFQSQQAHLDLIGADLAWSVTLGSSDVVVGIVDEGIDIDHPDLAANVWQNPDEVVDGVDNDGNGFTDDINGWDFHGNDADVRPTGTASINAHGTAVAGLIAAVQNNGIGVSGVAPACRLLPCRGFSGSGSAGDFALGEAIRYAANYADVINASWGGSPPNNTQSSAIDFAITDGRGGKGCVLLFASGNDEGAAVDFPARYAWTIAVGETTLNDSRHVESNFDETLTLVAPQAAWSTDISGPGGFDSPDPDYTDGFGGTSSSTPLVSGAAALLFSAYPELTGTEAVLAIINGLDNPILGIVPNDHFGKSPTLGYGRLNAGKSVNLGTAALDDRLEPNDSLSDAALVYSGYYPWLYLGDNQDVYAFDAVVGSTIRIRVEHLSLLGAIDVDVLNEFGAKVASSVTSAIDNTLTSTIDFIPPVGGRYYARVFGVTSTQVPYTLEIRAPPADDASEPNQSVGQGPLLTPGAGTTYQNLIALDDDFYQVFMTSGEYFYGLISFNHDEADLDIELLDPNEAVVRVASDLSYGEEILPYQATTTGNHAVRVSIGDDGTNQEYSMHLAVSATAPIVGTGNDDPFEDNDTAATAAAITEGFHPHLAVDSSGGEIRDLFRFPVPAEKSPRVTIGWSGSQDIDLRIYDLTVLDDPPNTPPLARSIFVNGDVESVNIPAIHSATEYLIDILRAAGAGPTPYRLAIEFIDPRPADRKVAFWRFAEGTAGQPCNPMVIRDWRGPLHSHSPVGYPGLGGWVTGPDPFQYPGSDRLALDCSGGGAYFPGGGDRGELSLGDQDFTLWARINPTDNSSGRTVAGIPGSWELFIGSDNTLDAAIGVTSSLFAGGGPEVTPGMWQDVALIYGSGGQTIRLVATGMGGGGLIEATLSTGGQTPSGSGDFHIGSSAGGSQPLGSVEQVRYFNQVLSSQEIESFSLGSLPASVANWNIYH